MKSRKTEKGSVLHIVVVIILVVIILGLLGYVFYTKFLTHSTNSTSNTSSAAKTSSTQSQSAPADPGYTYFSGGSAYGLPANVSFEYPTSWQVVNSAHSTFGTVGNNADALYHDSGSMFLQTANTVAGYAAQHEGGQQDNQATIIITLDTRYSSLDDVKTANYANDGQTTQGVANGQSITITTHVQSFSFTLGSESAVAFSELYSRSNGDNDTEAPYNNSVNDVQDFYVQHDSKVYRIFANGSTIDNTALQSVINKLISSWKWL